MDFSIKIRILKNIENFEPYFVLFLGIVGCIGNSISFFVFCFTKFR